MKEEHRQEALLPIHAEYRDRGPRERPSVVLPTRFSRHAREVDELCRDVAIAVTELRVQERGAEIESGSLPERDKQRRRRLVSG